MFSIWSNTGPWHQYPQAAMSHFSYVPRSAGSTSTANSARSLRVRGPSSRRWNSAMQPRGLAAIELVTRGTNPLGAASPGLCLRRRHPPQRLAELPLDEHLAGPEGAPVLEIERGGGRPAAILLDIRRHLVRGERRDRKAALRMLRRRRRHLRKRHRAPALQRRAPRVGRGRHHRAREARWDLAAVPRLEVRDRGLPWIRADSGYLPRLARAGQVHEDRRHAGHLTISGWTTPRQMPAATPASIALPPAVRHPGGGFRGQRVTTGHGPAPCRWPAPCGWADGAVRDRWAEAESRSYMARQSYIGGRGRTARLSRATLAICRARR